MESSQLVLRVAAGTLSIAAGIVHVALAADHVDHLLELGLFAGAATLQLAWGVGTLARARHRVSWLLGGVALQLACCGAWGMSRLVGLPIGHHAGEAQAVGLLDTAVAGTQLAVVAAILGLALRAPGRVAIPLAVAGMLLFPAALLLGLDGGSGHTH